MTGSQIQTILSAVESAEIKQYQFITDNNDNYYNHDSSIVKFDSGNDILWAIGLAPKFGNITGNGAIIINGADSESVHEFRTTGDYESIKKLADALSIELTDDDQKLLLQINANNLVVKPVTGDYSNVFHKLSKEEYDALTDEEKAEYDEHVKKEEERFKLPKGIAGRIDNNYNFPYGN